MGLNLNTNLSSIQAQQNLLKTGMMRERNLMRLASGFRINRAGDDAAGLGITERMGARIRGYDQAIRNVNDGISMVKTADGAHEQVSENLTRIRELAVQAGNGVLSDTDRATIQEEIDGLVEEIDRIAEGTEFNGRKLLDGSLDTEIVGDPDGDRSIHMAGEALDAASLGVDALDVTTAEGTAAAIEKVDEAVDKVADSRSRQGAYLKRFESTLGNLEGARENMMAARSQIKDADMAQAFAEEIRFRILQEQGTSILSQANASPMSVLRLLG